MDRPDNILSSVCPIPSIYGGKLIDGYTHKQPTCCIKCSHQGCKSADNEIESHQVCNEGLSFYPSTWAGEPIVFNGLVVEDRNHKISGQRRKDLRRLWIKNAEVIETIQRIKLFDTALRHELLVAAKETISFLHDVRTSTGVLLSNCENVIYRIAGANFTEKLAILRREDSQMFNLYQAINLLTEQLNLADIISNPESVRYGPKSTSAIFPFVYKMAKLFQAKAHSRNMHISVEGDARVHISTYQSFQLIPLLLLDNAIKYGNPGTTILVQFTQTNDLLYFAVTSAGDTVPEDECDKIFTRHFRGANAAGRHPHGSGLGLFLAREIATVHGYELAYGCNETKKVNTFTLYIPKQEWVTTGIAKRTDPDEDDTW